MKHTLASFLLAQSIAIGCMMPAAQTTPQGSPNGNNNAYGGDNSYGGGGGVDCNAYCSRQAECGMADFQACSNYCARSSSDAYFAQAANDMSDDSCEELAVKAQQQQQQPSGGGGGGDGSGCRASASRGGNPVQDCPAMQQCCGGGCHSIGYCSMPSGR